MFCWENATLVSNKSVNVDAAKILMASHPGCEGDNQPDLIYTTKFVALGPGIALVVVIRCSDRLGACLSQDG